MCSSIQKHSKWVIPFNCIIDNKEVGLYDYCKQTKHTNIHWLMLLAYVYICYWHRRSMFLNACIHRCMRFMYTSNTHTELWCIQGLISIDKDECESMLPSLLGKQILYQNLCLWNTHTHSHTNRYRHKHKHISSLYRRRTPIKISVKQWELQKECEYNCRHFWAALQIKLLEKMVIWLTQGWMEQSACDELVVFMEAHFFVVVYFTKIFNDTFLSRVLHSVIYAFMQSCGHWWLVLVQTAMCLT